MMAAMVNVGPVALVSGDLLLGSRLRAALAGTAELRMTAGDEVGAAELVFVDLNSAVASRIALIEQLRAAQPAVRIVGFCQHDARDVRIVAMERGADEVVTNGSLAAAALRSVGVARRG